MQDLPRDTCEMILARNHYGRIGCYSKTAQEVYVAPISYAYSTDRADALYFATLTGQKLEYLRQHPAGVCLEVDEIDDEQNWLSVIVTGRFEELRGAERDAQEWPALDRAEHGPLRALFTKNVTGLAICSIRIDKMTGRKERWSWDEDFPLLVERTRS